jgi:hypothetical protein
MYDPIIKAGATALITLAVICTTSIGAGLNGIEFNGTTYILGDREAEVIVPVNASELNFTLNEMVGNMTLLDEKEKSVPFNRSYEFWQGEYTYRLDFDRHVTGSLIYNITLQGQQFVLPVRDHRSVRIILPEGYTTGARSLGITRPAPDTVSEDNAGNILIWNNTTSISYIEVNYYRKNAPQALALILSILALAGLALLIEYYFSIRKLRAARMEEENEIKKKVR